MGPIVGLVARRLVFLPIAMIAVSIMAFFLVSISPFDPVDAYLGPEVRFALSSEERANIARAWGFDASPPEQYLRWLGNLFQGNFGRSTMLAGQPVLEAMGQRLPATLMLMGTALGLILIGGLILGVLAAAFRDTWVDWLIRNVSYLGTFAPSFWLALLSVYLFAIQLGWFPAGGASDFRSTSGPALDLHHLILPAVTLAISQHAWFTLYVRNTMLEILREDYVRYARAQGISEPAIFVRHALPNALIPFATLAGSHTAELIGGSVLIESIFAWPGLGVLAQRAAQSADIPLIVGIFLFGTVFVIAGNLFADISYRLLDPRVREAAR